MIYSSGHLTELRSLKTLNTLSWSKKNLTLADFMNIIQQVNHTNLKIGFDTILKFFKSVITRVYYINVDVIYYLKEYSRGSFYRTDVQSSFSSKDYFKRFIGFCCVRYAYIRWKIDKNFVRIKQKVRNGLINLCSIFSTRYFNLFYERML